MKKLNSKLTLNKKTIEILDDKSLQNVRGGKAADALAASCGLFSCNTKTPPPPTE
jgi:hypothetical protein